MDSDEKKKVNSMVKFYVKNKNILYLIKAIRYWAKKKKVNDNFQRGINSFGWTIIALCFLAYKKDILFEDYTNKNENFKSEFNVGDKFSEFFDFMRNFNITTHKLSLTEGGMTDKKVDNFVDSTYLVVQEPFNNTSNVTRHVDEKSWKNMKKLFENTSKMIEKKLLLDDIC